MENKRLIMMCSLIVIMCSILYAQSIDEVLGKYYEALGGLEKLRSLKSVKVTENIIFVDQAGMEVKAVTFYKSPNKIRMDAAIQDQKVIRAFDGKNAWHFMPIQGIIQPTPMPEEEATYIANSSDFYPLVDYSKRGYRLELIGKEDLKGSEAFKLKLTNKNGFETFYFLDCKSGLPVKVARTLKMGEAELIVESLYKDYRKIDWFSAPFYIETLIDGNILRKILLEKMEINPEVEDSFFQMPFIKD